MIGRLANNWQVSKTTSGKKVVKGSLAVKRKGTDKTDFINVVAFDKRAEVMEKYIAKGQLFGINGTLIQNNYTNKNNEKVYSYDVVISDFYFLEKKKDDTATIENVYADVLLDADDLPF